MNDIQKLLAFEAIKQTKARYFYGVDSRDWKIFASSFTEDVVMIVPEQAGNPRAVVNGRDNVIELVSHAMAPVTTMHFGHTPVIELTSDTTAKVIWAMEDHLWKREEFPDAIPCNYAHGVGHYLETYKLVDGDWLISHIELTRLRMDMF
jgi:hypothetical protein